MVIIYCKDKRSTRIRELIAYFMLLVCSIVILMVISRATGYHAIPLVILGILSALIGLERIISWLWASTNVRKRQPVNIIMFGMKGL